MTGLNGFEIDAAIYTRAARARLRLVEVPSFEGYASMVTASCVQSRTGFGILRIILREWRRKLLSIQTEDISGFPDRPEGAART